MSDRLAHQLANVKKWPKKAGKADYLRFLSGERLTRDQVIKAMCYSCVAGEDTDPCTAVTCTLIQYCPWNTLEESGDSGDTET